MSFGKFDYARTAESKRPKPLKLKKNVFYLGHPSEIKPLIIKASLGFRGLVLGTSGGGKTCLLANFYNQYPCGLLIDLNNSFIEKTIKEDFKVLGIEKERFKVWDFGKKYVGERKSYGVLHFKMNACDLGKNVKEIFGLKKDFKKAMVFDAFFNLPKQQRTYVNLKKLFSQAKENSFFYNFEWLFSKTDDGLSLNELMKDRNVLHCFGQTSNSLGLAILLVSLVDFRRGLFGTNDFFLLAVDEAQSLAKQNSFVGNAVAYAINTGRKFGIHSICLAPEKGVLVSAAKDNWSHLFVCKTVGKPDDLRKRFGIDADNLALLDDLSDLPDYGVILFVNGKRGYEGFVPYNYFVDLLNKHAFEREEFVLEKRSYGVW